MALPLTTGAPALDVIINVVSISPGCAGGSFLGRGLSGSGGGGESEFEGGGGPSAVPSPAGGPPGCCVAIISRRHSELPVDRDLHSCQSSRSVQNYNVHVHT